MDFTKAVASVIAGICPRTMAHPFVIVTPCLQAAVDVVPIAIDQSTRRDRRLDQRFERHLLDVCQHPNDHVAATFDHAEDRRFLAGEGTAPSASLESPSSPRAPFVATAS